MQVKVYSPIKESIVEQTVGNWEKRPKGCKRTISGMHTPVMSLPDANYQITISCSSCGLIDDTGVFTEWLFPNHKKEKNKKIDDSKPI